MEDNLFFAILRESLWHKGESIPKELTGRNVAKLFALAEQQAVSGLILDMLMQQNVKMPQQWVFETVGLLEQIKQQNRIVNNGVVKLNKLMSEGGINYVIVKGQIIASLYTDPLLRQSGDIDYYCDEQNFHLAQEVIRNSWQIEAERGTSEMHVHFDYHGVTYEGHFLLANLYGRRRNMYWQQLLLKDSGALVCIKDKQICTLSPTLHTLYVYIHLYDHLMALGVGLRQFCDLAVMLHEYKSVIDMEALRRHLEMLGLEKAYRACGSILVDFLGLSKDELGYSLNNADRKYGRKIMDVVMYRGNMGHYNKRNGFRGWRHMMEATGIKFSHFLKFMPLAPSYSSGWLWYECRRNVKKLVASVKHNHHY